MLSKLIINLSGFDRNNKIIKLIRNLQVMNFYKKLYPILGILLFYSLSNTGKMFGNTKSFEWYPVGVDNYGNITQ